LGDQLDQHPSIRWDGEVYHEPWVRKEFMLPAVDNAPFLRRQMLTAGSRYYGFEIKVHPEQQLLIVGKSLLEYIDQIIGLGVTHHVILERRNYLRRMLSMAVGAKTKQRHIRSGGRANLTKINIDVDQISVGMIDQRKPLLQCLREIDQTYRILEDRLRMEKTLHIVYEDDVFKPLPVNWARFRLN